jgi:hypothetical protein
VNEHQLSRKIVEHVRKEFGPNAVVFKLNDRITRGIPDIAVTRGGKTTWLEVKLFSCAEPSESELKKKLDKVQRHELTRLRDAGRAFYVMGYYEDKNVRLVVVAPENADKFGAYRFGRSNTLNDDLRMLLTFL